MSVPQHSGDLTSPSTYMNNTHTGLFNTTQHQLGQQQDLTQQQGSLGLNQESAGGSSHYLNSMLPQQHHQHSDAMMPPASGAAVGDFGRSSMLGDLGSLHDHDPLQHGSDALSSHPLMLATADSLLSQGSTDLCGLGEPFDVEGVQQQHGSSFGAAAAATRISIDMQDVLNADTTLPSMHTSSPQLHAGSHSPGLSHFGGSGHTAALPHSNESYTADSLKAQQQNGTHYGGLVPQQTQQLHHHHQQQQQQQQQQRVAAAQQQQQRQTQAPSRQQYGGSSRASSSAAAAAAAAAAGGDAPPQPVFRSQYRGVSYDKKKRKWRVQIKVAALGKSGVSVGYFDTEDAAARAYDRAAIGLLGRQNCKAVLNFPIEEYDNDSVPELVGKSREEVKATLKSERAKMPRRRLTHRRRTSRYLGVGSSNRKNQWQARILYHGKVTHLGYYRTEEEAARVYDKVSISLHGAGAQTNFPIDQYKHEVGSLQQKLSGLTREELQRALGVKPMDKSSRYRGVSKKKGRWEAKVMLNRKWAYRELFDTEAEAARAYDTALWRLKPREARNYANFKDSCPPDVAEMLAALEKDTPLAMHPTGLPLTAKPLIDAGLLYDDEGQSIRAPNGLTRSVSIGDLISVGDSAGQSVSEEPSAGNGSAGRPPMSGDGASGGAGGAVAGGAEGISSLAGQAAAGGLAGPSGMVKSASYSALSGLDGAVTSSLAAAPATDPAAAAAAPVPLSSLPASARSGLRGKLTHVHLHPQQGDGFGQQQQQHQQQQLLSSSFSGAPSTGRGLGGMPRVQSVPHLRSYGSDAGSPTLPPLSGGGSGHMGGPAAAAAAGGVIPGLPMFGSSGGGGYGGSYEQQQWMAGGLGPQQHQQQHQHPQHVSAFGQPGMQGGVPIKAESAYWTPELSYPVPDQPSYPQQAPQQQHQGLRASRSCGNLAFMAGGGSSSMALSSMQGGMQGMHPGGHGVPSPPGNSGHTFGSSGSGGGAGDFGAETKPLMVRVGSEQHLLNPNPNPGGLKGMTRIASESHLSSMVPLSPGHQFLGPDRSLLDGPGPMVPSHEGGGFGGNGSGFQHQQQQHQQHPGMHGYGSGGGYSAPMGGMPGYGGMQPPHHMQQHSQQHHHMQQQQPQHMYHMGGGQQGSSFAAHGGSSGYVQQQGMQQLQQGMQQLQPGSLHIGMSAPPGSVPSMPPLSPVRQQQGSGAAGSSAAAAGGSARAFRTSSSGGMHRAHSAAALESIDEMAVFRLQGMRPDMDGPGLMSARGHSLPGSLGVLPPMGGAPVSASGAYLAQQQQGPGGPMMQPGGSFGSNTSTMPPISTALPVHGDMRQQQQQQPYGQQGVMHSHFVGPDNSSGMYGMGGMPQGSGSATGSAAAAAAAFSAMSAGDDKWGVMGPGAAPDSPLGVVQIGGEELDVTMAFLADNSPRHMGDADGGLDITGLLTDPASLRPPSPPLSNSTSALLFGNGPDGAAGDTATKMDE